MQLYPRGLEIGYVLAIGWKLVQFSSRSEQRRRRDLTNYKHVQQPVVNVCTRSDLDAAPCLPPVAHNCHRAAATNFPTRHNQRSLVMLNIDCQNCTHNGVCGWAKESFEVR